MTMQQEGQLTPAERRQFVRDHRTAIFAYGRKIDGPAMTALYYVMDGDDILISTMRARAKAKAVQRSPKVSLCILDENWPPTYITVFCDAFIDATVDDDLDAVVDLSLRIGAVMAGRELGESMREQAAARVIEEDRVKLRLKPYATFMTPPRHARNESEFAKLTHWTSSSIPWDADQIPHRSKPTITGLPASPPIPSTFERKGLAHDRRSFRQPAASGAIHLASGKQNA